jgi:DNA-3-methyladenine glycosylase II
MRRAIQHLRSCDPVLSTIISHVGPYRMVYRPPEFSTVVRSIVYQQVTGKAAATIIARLEAAAGGLKPRAIAGMTDEALRACGLSAQKRSYIQDLAEKTLTRKLRFRGLADLPDEEVIQRLTAVKGVGVWTAQMFLMFALRRQDVLPTGDLGIQVAMQKAYGLSEKPKPPEMMRLATPWRPYATAACWYLWRSLDGPAEL